MDARAAGARALSKSWHTTMQGSIYNDWQRHNVSSDQQENQQIAKHNAWPQAEEAATVE
jgi:hypothetical protein